MKEKKERISILKVVLSISMILCFNGILMKDINAESMPTVKYQSHVQNIGWMSVLKNGGIAGTTGKSLRMEALKITLNHKKKSMINYRTHVSNIGWQSWKSSGQLAGTTGKSRAIEAIQIKLIGDYAKKYDVYYSVHVPYKGWLGWAKNGAVAGSTGLALRTEAIKIVLVRKRSKFNTCGISSLSKPYFSYRGHSQLYGWGKTVGEGNVVGTTGQSKRLEACIINFKNFDGRSGITYKTHVSNIGWQNWCDSGCIAGTTGQSRQIEAIQIKLTGGMEKFFDIYYRLHVANFGWLGWARNGEVAGTTGGGIRAEALQIRIVVKSSSFNVGGTHYYDMTNNGIRLKHYMTQSMKQPYSGPCAAYAYGIGLSIVLKRNIDPMIYYRNNLAYYDNREARVGAYDRKYDAKKIYEALKKGKPTMINYGNSNDQHWVLIMGIYNGVNINNIKYSDFICIDSSTGTEKRLTDAWLFSKSVFYGMKIFC